MFKLPALLWGVGVKPSKDNKMSSLWVILIFVGIMMRFD
jgi:hypothetical protein